MRAEKFLYKTKNLIPKLARLEIAKGSLIINGRVNTDFSYKIKRFDKVCYRGECLQSKSPVYLILNKPKGYVSATIDLNEKTVLDLIDLDPELLHLAGRLDKNTTGLVLITNDSQWSSYITKADSKVGKGYQVISQKPICPDMVAAFEQGIYFEKEKTWTHPAVVELIDEKTMNLTIFEGMHHQIKRMFLKFDNRVAELHRYSVGSLKLGVKEGEWRHLDEDEVRSFLSC